MEVDFFDHLQHGPGQRTDLMKMIFDDISGLNTVKKEFLIRKWLLCHIIVLNKNKPQQIFLKTHRIQN